MNRTKHVPQLLMAAVILKREDPDIEGQWDHGHDSWIYTVLVKKKHCCFGWVIKTVFFLEIFLKQPHSPIDTLYNQICKYQCCFCQPETRRQITKSWLKIGTSVFARIIRTARWNWAAQIRIPTKSEAATKIGHMVPVSMFQQKYRVNVVSSCFVGTK